MRYAWRRMVVRDPHLTDASRRVLLELESYADPDGYNARPGRLKIAESLLTEDGHVSEKTVRRALTLGVELGFIECTTKGKRGRMRNSADVYCLTFPTDSDARLVDTQMSTSHNSSTGHLDVHQLHATSGHPNVHQSGSTSGHLETTSGHLTPTSGHPDVHPPVHYTSPLTPDPLSHLSNACARTSADTEKPKDDFPVEVANAGRSAPTASAPLCRLCNGTGYFGTVVCDHNPDRINTAKRGKALVDAALAAKRKAG